MNPVRRPSHALIRRGVVTWILLAASFIPGPPTAGAQGGEAPPGAAIVVNDPANDVKVGLPSSPAQGAPASEGLDILEAQLFGESGESLQATIKLTQMSAAKQLNGVDQGVRVYLCFEWRGKLYAVELFYIYSSIPVLTRQTFGVVNGACDPTVDKVTFAAGQTSSRVSIYLDAEANTIRYTIDRIQLGMLLDPAKVDPPAKGDALGKFYVFMRDGRGLRYDPAPDNGPSADVLTLTSNTANLAFYATPDSNVPTTIPCGERQDLRSYAVEAGGSRGVPILLVNRADKERPLSFNVTRVAGPDWKPRMMPGLTLPPSTENNMANLSVNVLLTLPPETLHKDCTTIRVRAVDVTTPDEFAETTVNVIAVQPPTRTRNTLYMHTAELATDVCADDKMWLNTLQDDKNDKKKPILFIFCQDVSLLSLAEATMLVRVDVNPSHDLVLNTSAPGIDGKVAATLTMKSDGVPTRARIELSLISGFAGLNSIGEGSRIVDIGTNPTTFTIDVPVAFTREFRPNGDPSRIAEARDGLGILVHYVPLGDPNVDVVKTAGRVYLLPEGTHFVLPIWATIARNVIEPGKEGGLLSIRRTTALASGDVLFAVPGSARLVNYSILNEGATPDMATVSVNFTGPPGWTATVIPPGPFWLQAGDRTSFQVVVRPPATAKESESVLVDVVVDSESGAHASDSVKVVASQTGGTVDNVPELRVAPKEKGFLPGPSFAVWGFAVGLLVWVRRRRL